MRMIEPFRPTQPTHCSPLSSERWIDVVVLILLTQTLSVDRDDSKVKVYQNQHSLLNRPN